MFPRRGPFRPGDRVKLSDPRGRLHTIVLTPGDTFHTHRGSFAHDDLIGREEGTLIATSTGTQYVAMRPLLADYVMSMPRGATVVYPKDAGQIVAFGDIFPGAVVVEAGAGSGALSMSLLSAIGPSGRLISAERRAEFADIARANVQAYFGTEPDHWDLRVGDVDSVLDSLEPASVDRVVLDMLAPWENLTAVARALAPGGVLTCYVATVTQMARLIEEMRLTERFIEPNAWESTIRDWHVEGLAVRPEHRMVGHTGFLITTRVMSDGVVAPPRRRRPAPGAEDPEGLEGLGWHDATFDEGTMGVRPVTARKIRKLRRTFAAQANAHLGVSASAEAAQDLPGDEDHVEASTTEPAGDAPSSEADSVDATAAEHASGAHWYGSTGGSAGDQEVKDE